MTAETVEIPGYIAGTWDIDPVHSHIGFVARHLMVSKVRGNFGKFEGQIVTAEDPLQSSATATIDTTSFDTGNDQRNSDVKSENFLDVANYPADDLPVHEHPQRGRRIRRDRRPDHQGRDSPGRPHR